MKITEYEIEELPTIGWLVDMEIGQENLYFTLADGSRGFCKCLDAVWPPTGAE